MELAGLLKESPNVRPDPGASLARFRARAVQKGLGTHQCRHSRFLPTATAEQALALDLGPQG
jgi:hypothetical protein